MNPMPLPAFMVLSKEHTFDRAGARIVRKPGTSTQKRDTLWVKCPCCLVTLRASTYDTRTQHKCFSAGKVDNIDTRRHIVCAFCPVPQNPFPEKLVKQHYKSFHDVEGEELKQFSYRIIGTMRQVLEFNFQQ